MDKKRWQRIQELFERAQSMAPTERDDFLAEQSSDDLSIADEVRSMLAGVPPSEFLNAPSNLPPDESYSGGGLEGLKMGEFELIEEIGHGGMGVVYRAHQPGLERDVAVKILPKIRTGDEQALERFRREAKAASNLNHPNVVPILSVGESHGMAWYAMALIEGQDLGAFIHDLKSGSSKAEAVFGKFGTDDYFRNLAAAFAQVCDAVHYAHQSGVIHRDIKPANILLDPNGKLLLTDFGLAKDERFGSMSVSGQLHGTPHYMSPEQARASVNKIDHRTDIYSLAVVLFELCCLAKAFRGDTALEVIEKITAPHAPDLRKLERKIPTDLTVLVHKGMSKGANHRFGEAGDLAVDLRRYCRGKPILTQGPTAIIRLLSNIKRHENKLKVFSALVVAAVASIGANKHFVEQKRRIPVRVHSTDPGIEIDVYQIDLVERELTFLQTETTSFKIPPGNYRFVARLGDSYCEFTRYPREKDQPIHLRPRFRKTEEVVSGMVEIANYSANEVGLRGVKDYRGEPYKARPYKIDQLWVDRTEVSNGEYWLYCKDEAGAFIPIHWQDDEMPADLEVVLDWNEIPGYANTWASLPVIGVPPDEARRFAEWAGKRLLTLEEWFAVARGPSDFDYPWGNEKDSRFDMLNFGHSNEEWERPWDGYWEFVWPCDRYNEVDITSDFGLINMFGNVAEWTESRYLSLSASGATPEVSVHQVVYVGEGWRSRKRGSAYLGAFGPNDPAVRSIGFRCAKGTYKK